MITSPRFNKESCPNDAFAPHQVGGRVPEFDSDSSEVPLDSDLVRRDGADGGRDDSALSLGSRCQFEPQESPQT